MDTLTKEQLSVLASKVHELNAADREETETKDRDKRLRNTKLLLQNYRTFKVYAKKIEKNAVEEWDGIGVEELLVFGEDLVKSIRQSSQRTLVMVQHIDLALATLKHLYEQEKHPGTRRQFDILHERYIKGCKIEEIAENNEIDNRSVYRAIDSATERLSLLLFGVYGLKIE